MRKLMILVFLVGLVVGCTNSIEKQSKELRQATTEQDLVNFLKKNQGSILEEGAIKRLSKLRNEKNIESLGPTRTKRDIYRVLNAAKCYDDFEWNKRIRCDERSNKNRNEFVWKAYDLIDVLSRAEVQEEKKKENILAVSLEGIPKKYIDYVKQFDRSDAQKIALAKYIYATPDQVLSGYNNIDIRFYKVPKTPPETFQLDGQVVRVIDGVYVCAVYPFQFTKMWFAFKPRKPLARRRYLKRHSSHPAPVLQVWGLHTKNIEITPLNHVEPLVIPFLDDAFLFD
jgi:hypothetical protein